MKLIIAGGRNYPLSEDHFRFLDTIHKSIPVTMVLSGTARGADYGGEVWAAKRGIPVKRFKPDWARLGKIAGFARNADMAREASALAVFPGGKGTADMKQRAEIAGLTVYEYEKLK